MTEKYDTNIDLNNDEIYDYVLEREHNIGLKNQNNFSQAWTDEHFNNRKNRNFIKNCILVVIIIIILYFLYSYSCEEIKT